MAYGQRSISKNSSSTYNPEELRETGEYVQYVSQKHKPLTDWAHQPARHLWRVMVSTCHNLKHQFDLPAKTSSIPSSSNTSFSFSARRILLWRRIVAKPPGCSWDKRSSAVFGNSASAARWEGAASCNLGVSSKSFSRSSSDETSSNSSGAAGDDRGLALNALGIGTRMDRASGRWIAWIDEASRFTENNSRRI